MTLHLILIKKWFDMISIQEKTEEYRDITHYWERRLFKEDNDKIVPKDFSTVEFRNGYQKDARRMLEG